MTDDCALLSVTWGCAPLSERSSGALVHSLLFSQCLIKANTKQEKMDSDCVVVGSTENFTET